jgi:hypothetical protein
VLPGIACAGNDVGSNESENTITSTNHTDHEEEEDCGNFCRCSCCVHIVSVNFQSAFIVCDKPLLQKKQLSFYHNISLPSNYFGNIWQPPKMS